MNTIQKEFTFQPLSVDRIKTVHATASPTVISPIPTAITTRPPMLVVKLGSLFLQVAEPLLAHVGLDGRDYAALCILSTDRPSSQQELGQLLGIAGPIVVTVLDNLEGKGLVERRRSVEDRRRTEVVLTNAGDAVLTELDASFRSLYDEMFSAVSPSDRAVFEDVVRRVITSTAEVCLGDGYEALRAVATTSS